MGTIPPWFIANSLWKNIPVKALCIAMSFLSHELIPQETVAPEYFTVKWKVLSKVSEMYEHLVGSRNRRKNEERLKQGCLHLLKVVECGNDRQKRFSPCVLIPWFLVPSKKPSTYYIQGPSCHMVPAKINILSRSLHVRSLLLHPPHLIFFPFSLPWSCPDFGW